MLPVAKCHDLKHDAGPAVMGEWSEILSPSLKNELLQQFSLDVGRMARPATVARRQSELATDAWRQCEQLVRVTAEFGALALHAGQSADQVRTTYRKAAVAYADMLRAIDFTQPVEQLLSVTGRDVADVESQYGTSFLRIKRDRFGESYGIYLAKLAPLDYEAECALTCAIIAQDWPLAESLARDLPIPLSTSSRPAMTLSLLRYTVLGRRAQVEKRSKIYSDRASGIDFPPRKAEFALAIAGHDEPRLRKALKGTLGTFREKWNLDKYVTPRWLRLHKSRAQVHAVSARRLLGLRWGYSAWAVAMMCLAGRAGLPLPTDPRHDSGFVPQELYLPAT